MILFISDLHLSPRSPGATALFLRFLAGRARQAEALYILGDFFEVWVGDDIDDAYHTAIISALRAASDAGAENLVSCTATAISRIGEQLRRSRRRQRCCPTPI